MLRLVAQELRQTPAPGRFLRKIPARNALPDGFARYCRSSRRFPIGRASGGDLEKKGGRKSMKPYEMRVGIGGVLRAGGERRITHTYENVEERIVAWMAAHGISFLRVSLGVVFLWFGGLKLVPGLSPAEGLAGATIAKLTFGLVEPKVAVAILAVWETGIGFALVFGVQLRLALALLFLQMAGTLTPLLLFPAETFTRFPFAPTMEGQYILKNMVLISGAIVVGATLHGGTLVAKPLRE